MARATILSSLGAGLYRVQLHFDNSRIATRLAHMATKIADYSAELAALEPDKTTKATALNTALTAMNNYINATDPAVYAADPTELNALNKATWTARGELDVILHDEKLLKLKKAALEKETDQLNKLCPADFETNAWCVEYVEDLSGETEAIECDYLLWRDVANNQIEHDTGIWLPSATTPATNALIHPLSSSEHATWFNLCMAPAAQRHAGRYRIATLSNLSGNACDVAFDGRHDVVRENGNVIDNAPIHPQFPGGQQNHYSGANIIYGTCNGAAFANGDRVIVDLHSGIGVPTVIGFYSNPRQCSGGGGGGTRPVEIPLTFLGEQIGAVDVYGNPFPHSIRHYIPAQIHYDGSTVLYVPETTIYTHSYQGGSSRYYTGPTSTYTNEFGDVYETWDVVETTAAGVNLASDPENLTYSVTIVTWSDGAITKNGITNSTYLQADNRISAITTETPFTPPSINVQTTEIYNPDNVVLFSFTRMQTSPTWRLIYLGYFD